MMLSFMLGSTFLVASGYPSMACADDERILLVYHNPPLPGVCKRDIEGVFYIEEGDDLPACASPTYVA